MFRQETRAYTPLVGMQGGMDGGGGAPTMFAADGDGAGGMSDYAASGMRDRSYQKRSGAMVGT